MKKMKPIFSLLLLLTNTDVFSQDSTNGLFSISGYAEAYYQYDFNTPASNNRPDFIYSHNRHNEFNINLAFIKVSYTANKVRANLALATGTYMNANLAAEPGVLKNIYEANVGVKLSKQKNVWMDAGIFASHIGFESAISKDCRTLTRSIAADNSPYYEAGAKITFVTDDGKWLLSGLALNGWQRIKRVDGNSLMSWGSQIQLKPSDKILVNYSTFIGSDAPDSSRKMRYFHNLYGIFQLTDKLALTTGFDIGTEQRAKGSNQYNTWYSPVLILQIAPNAKNNFGARLEYYNDANEVIIKTGTPNGFKTWAYSINYDYLITHNVVWRVEGRRLSAKDKTFEKEGMPVNNNFSLTTSLAISF